MPLPLILIGAAAMAGIWIGIMKDGDACGDFNEIGDTDKDMSRVDTGTRTHAQRKMGARRGRKPYPNDPRLSGEDVAGICVSADGSAIQ